MKDLEVLRTIEAEQKRQNEHVELIASENFVSKDILEANASIFTNKYAEGYPGKRYYGGCENADAMENIAIKRLKKMFNANFANVQPHSGSQANFAVYTGLLNPGDKILGMSLNAGGHLTHGYHINASGKYFEAASYDVDPETYLLDYDVIREIAIKEKPQLIVCGASAYSRIIDWNKFVEIGKEVGALVMADVAHIAGLIVSGEHPNPLNAGVDVVTSTTHKTLRGARGGIILTNDEKIATKIDKAIFPGTQGGPLLNQIAGKAVAFGEALTPEFNEYQKQVVKNSKAFAKAFEKKGAIIISGGTDNHLFMVNVKDSIGITGQEAEDLMHRINITMNKNSIPFDTERPMVTSGFRVGTPAMTTKGWVEKDFEELTDIMWNVLTNKHDEQLILDSKQKVLDLINKQR